MTTVDANPIAAHNVDLDELERLEREAAPGPWEDDGNCIGYSPGVDPWHVTVVGQETKGAPYMEREELVLRREDRALIVAMRNALPVLLAERAQVKELMAALDEATAQGEGLREEAEKWKARFETEYTDATKLLTEHEHSHGALVAAYRERDEARAKVAELTTARNILAGELHKAVAAEEKARDLAVQLRGADGDIAMMQRRAESAERERDALRQLVEQLQDYVRDVAVDLTATASVFEPPGSEQWSECAICDACGAAGDEPEHLPTCLLAAPSPPPPSADGCKHPAQLESMPPKCRDCGVTLPTKPSADGERECKTCGYAPCMCDQQ